jgi:hypothetical protein
MDPRPVQGKFRFRVMCGGCKAEELGTEAKLDQIGPSLRRHGWTRQPGSTG